MQPDIPLNHSPYTPLASKRVSTQEREILIRQQLPLLVKVIEAFERDIENLKHATDLTQETILSDDFKIIALGTKYAIAVIKQKISYLQNQISEIEFSAEGNKPQGA